MKILNPKILYCLIPIFFGFISFYIVCGINIIDPHNLSWIIHEDQWGIHLSWIFYKNSPIEMPLGIISNYGVDQKTSLAFQAGILGIIFKIPSVLFGLGDFQFLGIWILTCFLFQSIFSWIFLGCITKSNSIRALSLCFFLFSPPFLARLGLHLTLIEHFLIILALYLSFKPAQKFVNIYWIILLITSLSLMFYVFFIIGVLWVGYLLDQFFIKKSISIRSIIVLFFMAIVIIYLFAWQLGYFIIPSSTAPAPGFGLFRSHILTFFDSAGSWSYIFPKIKTSQITYKDLPDFNLSDGIYEGFGYFGAGIIALLPFTFYGAYKNTNLIIRKINEVPFLMASIIFLSIYAISNNITFMHWNIEIPLPASIYNLLSIFRSSGRFIWPLFYLCIYLVIFFIVRTYSFKSTLLILLFGSFIQIYDTSKGWVPIRNQFAIIGARPPDVALANEFWEQAARRYRKILVAPLEYGPIQANWLPLSYFAARNNLSTNAIYQGRVNLAEISEANKQFDVSVLKGEYKSDSLYLINDDLVGQVSKALDHKRDLFARIDGFNVLAPGWMSCMDCLKIDSHSVIKMPQVPSTAMSTPIYFGKQREGFPYLLGVGQFSRLGWGWSYPESWGAWSEGRQAKLLIPYPVDSKPQFLEINIRALITSNHPFQKVQVWVNNELQQTVILDREENNRLKILLPKDSLRDYVLIDFRINDPVSAKQLGIGDDDRKLGIGIESAIFR